MEHNHIFITGCTNSGTGFLRFLVSKHPELSTLMEEGQYYCKALPHDHQFKHVKNRLFSLYPEIYRWNKKVAKKKGEAIRRDFYKNWNLSKKYLVEKSGHHMIRMGFTQAVFKPCKFIGIVRNGFVVCEGLKRKKKHKIKLCAKHWNRANKIMIEESKRVDFLLVKYEDLCSKPQEVMDTIFSYIGVDSIKIDLDWVIPRQNMFGLKKHFKLGSSPDFNKLSLDNLSDVEKDAISKVAQEMLVFFGYCGGENE